VSCILLSTYNSSPTIRTIYCPFCIHICRTEHSYGIHTNNIHTLQSDINSSMYAFPPCDT
jgi:hypothetical protein